MKPFLKAGLITLGIVGGVLLVVLFLVTRPGKAGHSPVLSLNIGKTESHNTMSSAFTSSTADHCTFSPRRVLFVQTDSGSLAQRIADLTVRGLANCPQIETVEVVKPSATATNGFLAPDLFVRMNVVDVDHSGIVSSTVKAMVEGSLGTSPWQSTHYSSSRTTAPIVQFTWNAWIGNESTFTGIRSDRYEESAQSIADALVKGISNQVAELSDKFPRLPELSGVFYGPYQPVSDFDFLRELKAKRVCSYYGMFMHNETFWAFQAATNPLPQLQRIVDQLAATGWKMGEVNLTNTYPEMIQARQGDSSLEIFREREPAFGQERNTTPARFVVHHRKGFSDAEIDAALETLFTAEPSIEILLPFESAFSSKQRERFYALLEKTPPREPFTCVSLAELYLSRKQTNAAVDMLLRAQALKVTLKDDSDLTSKINSIAKKISPKENLKLDVTPEICRQLAFLEFTNALQRIEVEGAFGKPLLWFNQGERGLTTSALLLRAPRKGICDWRYSQVEGYGRCSQWSSFDVTKQDVWKQIFSLNDKRVNVTARLLPDGKRIAFTLEAPQ